MGCVCWAWTETWKGKQMQEYLQEISQFSMGECFAQMWMIHTPTEDVVHPHQGQLHSARTYLSMKNPPVRCEMLERTVVG